MKENNVDLIELFTRIEWLLHRVHLTNHRHHGPMGDSRRGQGRVLAILKMQQEISQKDLTYLLDMRPQSLGELLTKLEKNGYIVRTPSETDRRIMNIKLTEEGKNATTEQQEFSFDKIFDCLTEDEQKILIDYLNRIIESLEAETGKEDSNPDFDPSFRGGNPFRGNPFEGNPFKGDSFRGNPFKGNPFEGNPFDRKFGEEGREDHRGSHRGKFRHHPFHMSQQGGWPEDFSKQEGKAGEEKNTTEVKNTAEVRNTTEVKNTADENDEN